MAGRPLRSLPRALEEYRKVFDRPYGWIRGTSHTRQRGVDAFCLTGGLDLLMMKGPHMDELRAGLGLKPIDPDLQGQITNMIYACLPEEEKPARNPDAYSVSPIASNRSAMQSWNDVRARNRRAVLKVIDCAIRDAKATRKKVS